MPSIQFGNRTPYNTRTQPYFANLNCHKLSSFLGILPQIIYHGNLTQMTSFNEFCRAAKDILLNS